MSRTIQTVHKTVAKSLHNPELSAIVDGEKKLLSHTQLLELIS